MKDIFLYVTLFFFIGCSTFDIMPNHNPEKLKAQAESYPTKKNFNNKQIILKMLGDKSLAPHGAYFDDFYTNVNSVNHSYVISQPGYILFEKVVDALQEQQAKVSRQYLFSLSLENLHVATVEIIVTEFEIHQWRESLEKTLILAEAKIDYCIREGQNKSDNTVVLQAKATKDSGKDIFKELAYQFTEVLHQELGETN